MIVRVRLFAVARELAGCEDMAVKLSDDATVADVRRELVAAVPALDRVVAHAMFAVDAGYAGDDTKVDERSEVALIPPVSGG